MMVYLMPAENCNCDICDGGTPAPKGVFGGSHCSCPCHSGAGKQDHISPFDKIFVKAKGMKPKKTIDTRCVCGGDGAYIRLKDGKEQYACHESFGCYNKPLPHPTDNKLKPCPHCEYMACKECGLTHGEVVGDLQSQLGEALAKVKGYEEGTHCLVPIKEAVKWDGADGF